MDGDEHMKGWLVSDLCQKGQLGHHGKYSVGLQVNSVCIGLAGLIVGSSREINPCISVFTSFMVIRTAQYMDK